MEINKFDVNVIADSVNIAQEDGDMWVEMKGVRSDIFYKNVDFCEYIHLNHDEIVEYISHKDVAKHCVDADDGGDYVVDILEVLVDALGLSELNKLIAEAVDRLELARLHSFDK